MKRVLVVLIVLLLVLSPLAFCQEAEEPEKVEETETIEEMQIIQLEDPFEITEAEWQKYFNLDSTYDYEEEATSIWTTIGCRTDVFDVSFTWEQQINPSMPGTATLSLNLWW